MADVERIAPPVPTLPSPVGRNIGSGRRPRAPLERPGRREPGPDDDKTAPNPPPEHMDEYV
jgi:hypothetical protein